MGNTILLSDRANFRENKIVRDKESHYIIIKKSLLQENITIFNVYVPTDTVSKCISQKLIKQQEQNRSIHYSSWRLQHLLCQKWTDLACIKSVVIQLSPTAFSVKGIVLISIDHFIQ